MAKEIGPVCRLCRTEGTKLFLKGSRCYSPRCALEKRNYAPGQHGQRHTRLSRYKMQLREKQKARRIAGLLEKQFRLYFKKADKKKGLTGENLLRFLELRLDNVVLRLGFATSRAAARQLVNHGHILVNSKKVDIPSYLTKIGDKISLKENSKNNIGVLQGQELVTKKGTPSWLELDREKLTGTVTKLPDRTEMSFPVQEQLIVELYSK